MTQPRKTAQEMFPLVEAYLEGHQTQKDFCQRHGFSTAKLNYWLAKYRRETTEKPDAFMEITPSPLPAEGALLEVVYPHGVRLRLFASAEVAYLAQLIAWRGT